MAVQIADVRKKSACDRKGIGPGDTLLSINGNEIDDVLDYRFFTGDEKLKIEYRDQKGRVRKCHVRNDGDIDNIGLIFDTYLMDRQRSCRNKCVFCFIDQLPKGLRPSLYFKDDDSRLSFLFGNYITLTNLSEHDVERIIRYHISPVNASVHTMNPELRVKMMKNPHAGESLALLKRFSDAGISINAQLVLCPGLNDGDELTFSLEKLAELESVASIAAVPVGLTKYREGLYPLRCYEPAEAAAVIDLIDGFNARLAEQCREKLAYPSDEFFLLSGRPIPPYDYYGDFPQLENGVGAFALTSHDFYSRLEETEGDDEKRLLSVATGAAAATLLREIAAAFTGKFPGTVIDVFEIKNEFFGERVTVAGLITGGDLIRALQGKLRPGTVLLLPSVMLKSREEPIFLDDVSVEDVKNALGVKVEVTDCGGDALFDAFSRKQLS